MTALLCVPLAILAVWYAAHLFRQQWADLWEDIDRAGRQEGRRKW